MIRFGLSVCNPWGKHKFSPIFCKSFHLMKHKFFEVEMYVDRPMLLYVELDLSFRGEDHAGAKLELGLFGFNLNLHLYDNRHWNHSFGTWA